MLELADRSKLGKGERDVRAAERQKQNAKIKVGIRDKNRKRAEAELEEVSFSPCFLFYFHG